MSASSRPRVHVTRRLPAEVERVLSAEFDAVLNEPDSPTTPASLHQALRDADAVLATVTDPLDGSCFAGELRTRVIANFGVGVNHIDLDAAKAAGIVVTNTPDVLTDDTADLAIALMLATLRRIGEGERELRSGRWTGWRPTHLMGRRLSGKTLGIVGLGRIGRAVAQRAAHGFGMRVLAWSRSKRRDSEAGTGIERVNKLDELLERSDIASLHCPLVRTTRHLIGAAQLERLGPEGILINTSRGPVVNEAALVEALAAGRIAGAGLDVYEDEPRVHPGLIERDDVVLLPHLGSATRESREAMGMKAIDNLRAFFAGTVPPDRVA